MLTLQFFWRQKLTLQKRFFFWGGHNSSAAASRHSLINSPSVRGFDFNLLLLKQHISLFVFLSYSVLLASSPEYWPISEICKTTLVEANGIACKTEKKKIWMTTGLLTEWIVSVSGNTTIKTCNIFHPNIVWSGLEWKC